MLVSKLSSFLATWKWLLKEKAATQWRSVWLSSVLFCHWGLQQGWLVDSLTLLQDWYHVAPESVAHTCSACIYLSRSGGSSIKPLEFQPNLGANRLFQFDDCFSNLFVWPPKDSTFWKFSGKLLIGTPLAGNQGAIPLNVKHSTSRPWTTQNVKVATLFDLKSTWWLPTALFHEGLSIWEKKWCYR